jgi:hypothetical protein
MVRCCSCLYAADEFWYMHNPIIKICALSPRANYTYRATAACRRGWCQRLRMEGRSVVSVTDPYGRNLGFLDRNRYLFFQVAPQLYSRGRVDPVPDPLLLRKSGSAGNRTRISGSVARNSYHRTTEKVLPCPKQ